MLIIQQPGSYHKKKTRRRIRALGYATAGLIIITCLFLTIDSNLWYAAVAVEAWWVWASLTDPGIRT
jgi:hypothetical protein